MDTHTPSLPISNETIPKQTQTANGGENGSNLIICSKMRDLHNLFYILLIGLQAHQVCLQEDRNVYDIIKENKDLSEVNLKL
jgi:hypothetical protein